MCRAKIDIKNVNLIINDTTVETIEEDKDKLLSKTANLLKLIKGKPTKRFMIFSEYEASLIQIREELDKLKINYSGIKGAGSTIQNIISKFKEFEMGQGEILRQSHSLGATSPDYCAKSSSRRRLRLRRSRFSNTCGLPPECVKKTTTIHPLGLLGDLTKKVTFPHSKQTLFLFSE